MGAVTFLISPGSNDVHMYNFNGTISNVTSMNTGAGSLNVGNNFNTYGQPITTPTSYYTKSSTVHQAIGFRFTNVTIANAEIINSATLDFSVFQIDQTGTGGNAGDGTVNVNIKGADVNTAADWYFANPTTNPTPTQSVVTPAGSGFAFTTAIKAYAISSTGRKSVDVKAIIEEITTRGGWSSGNALSLCMVANESQGDNARIRAVEYTGTANDPELVTDFGATFDGRVMIY